MSDHSDDDEDTIEGSSLGADDDLDEDDPQPPTMMMGVVASINKSAVQGGSGGTIIMEASDEGDVASAVSSLSAGPHTGISGDSFSQHATLEATNANSTSSKDHNANSITHHRTPPPPFRLAAPQVLDEDDSDFELEEDQQPSSQFIKDWEDDQGLPQLTSSNNNNNNNNQATRAAYMSGSQDLFELLKDSSNNNTSSHHRRPTTVRRPNQRLSQAWGDLMHGSNVKKFQASSSSVNFNNNSSNDNINNMSGSNHPSRGSFADLELPLSQQQQQQQDESNIAASKILQRMKQGIMVGSTALNISEYHDASTRTGSGRPKYGADTQRQQQEQDKFYRRILNIIVGIICLLVITLVAVVLVLLLQNQN